VPPREDPLTTVHKGLRSMIYRLSSRLQSNDFTDLDSTRGLMVDLEHDFAVARSAGCVVCILSHHATDEDQVMFPESAKVAPTLTAALIEDHHELARRELALTEGMRNILALEAPAARLVEGARLNREANQLFGAYLTHMNREDDELVPLLQEHFTDSQLVAMRTTIIARMPPERLFAIVGEMVPSMTPAELVEFFGSVRQSAPAPMITALADLCARKLDPARWAAVRSQVGV